MKTLFFIFVLFFTLQSFGQKIRFSDTTNEWRTIEFSCGGDPGTYLEIDSLIGEVIIHDTTYKKLCINSVAFAYVREDTLLKKVFAIEPSFPLYDTTEQLLYDYALQAGDTFKGKYINEYVDSVDSVIINGVWHKVWYLEPTIPWGTSSFVGYVVVEGIGCLSSPAYPLYPYFFEGCTTLTCFNNEGTTPRVSPAAAGYFDNATSCSLTFGLGTSNTKNKIETINIFPNPATNEITLQTNINGLHTITLFNLVGQSLLFVQTDKNETTLNTENIPPGLYEISVSTESGERMLEKIVIGK